MGRYSIIKKEFSFLESQYGFKQFMKQKHGAYYYSAWTNEKKDVMVLYDDRIDEREESPVWIRIYDADSFGTAYDDVDEYRKEFAMISAKPRERIRRAAEWLKAAIADKRVIVDEPH